MPYRIEVAGSLATGKTTLCDGLQAKGYGVIRENLDELFCLKRAYNNAASYHLDLVLAFTASKASAIETYEGSKENIVSDYAMISEYAYIDMHLGALDKEAMRLCMDLLDRRRMHMGEPDLIVHLQCPAEEQLRRIRARGRDFEQALTVDYIAKLNRLQDQYMNVRLSSDVPIISFDTTLLRADSLLLTDKIERFVKQNTPQP